MSFVASLVIIPALLGAVSTAALSATLTVGQNTNAPESLNPINAREGNAIPYFQAVYDTLILRKPDGELAPMLATEWAYNADRTLLTLKLRDDVKFTDGAAFDAGVAKANLEAFKNGTGSDAKNLKNVKEIRAVDPKTLEIQLAEPDPGILIYLSNSAGFMASPKAIGSKDLDINPVGSGPYTLDTGRTILGAQYTFVKNPSYWNPDLQKFDEINIMPMTNTTARLNALLSGQVDATLLNAGTVAAAEAAGMVPVITQVNWGGFAILDRAGGRSKELADVRVRQAIIHAIDREAVFREIFGGRGIATEQVFSPSTQAYLAEFDGYKVYPYDPERARQLLKEAGYPDGFALPYGKNADDDPAETAAIASYLDKVGIKLQVSDITADDLRSQVFKGQWPFWSASLFLGTDWLVVQTMIAPEALYNPFHIKSPEIDGYIAKIQSGDDATVTAAAEALNRYVVKEAWFMPYARLDRLFFTNKKITAVPQVQQSLPSIYNYAPAAQ